MSDLMMRPGELARLKAAPAVIVGGDELASIAKRAQDIDADVLLRLAFAASVPGREAIASFARADLESAVSAAKCIPTARETARALRKLATVCERGAACIEAGIAGRADRAEIRKELAR